jgi:hypothetical protein
VKCHKKQPPTEEVFPILQFPVEFFRKRVATAVGMRYNEETWNFRGFLGILIESMVIVRRTRHRVIGETISDVLRASTSCFR